MFPNRQLGFVIAEFVEHMGRIADGHWYVFGAISRELIRGPTIKGDPQAIAERWGKRAGVPRFARDGKPLAIRGGKNAAPPELTEWEVIVIIGFPEVSEKFFTLGEIALINQHLWALSTNAG